MTCPNCLKLRATMEIIAKGEEPGYPGSLAPASMLREIAADSLKPTPEDLGSVPLFPEVHQVGHV
jgi:hypothetical protein